MPFARIKEIAGPPTTIAPFWNTLQKPQYSNPIPMPTVVLATCRVSLNCPHQGNFAQLATNSGRFFSSLRLVLNLLVPLHDEHTSPLVSRDGRFSGVLLQASTKS